MSVRIKSLLIYKFFVLGLLVSSSQIATSEQINPKLSEKAREHISKQRGIPKERLNLKKEARLADTDITRFKLIDSDGTIYGVSLDANGNQVSDEVVNKALQAFNNKRFVGKLESDLVELIQKGDNNPIRVAFYLKDDAISTPFQGNTREERQNHLKKRRNRYAEIHKPLIDELNAKGQTVLYQSEYSPIIFAIVTPDVIKEIARRPDVERVYLGRTSQRGIIVVPDPNPSPGTPGVVQDVPIVQQPSQVDVSPFVIQADIVNSRLTGAGILQSVGIVERDRIGNHTNLPSTQRELCRPNASTTITQHKTGVTSVIQSNNQFVRGIAKDVTIIDGIMANNQDQESIAAINCVINNATATNMSYGFPPYGTFGTLARHLDKIVYDTGATIVVAVSNECNNKVANPEMAFNVIAVGAFGDQDTATRSDDVAPCTGVVTAGSYLNPDSPNGDREEPDVVAPGHNITMLGHGNVYLRDSGTSYAAPHVTAAVALLRQRKPDLFNRPAEVRAIIMASARHNLEGSSRLSDRDGAGGIMLAAADTIAATNGASDHIIVDGALSNFPITRNFTATNGQRVRVAISWDHKMPLGQNMSEPTTDLDLTVSCGSTIVGDSTSFDNNHEIVEFTAANCPGGYKATINNFRHSPGLEQIGFAVSRTDL